jgi:hypothetical protein
MALDADGNSLRTLTAAQLRGVATLWKQQQRTFVTSFQGASMLPTIAPGTAVAIVCDENARQGDVIVVLSRGDVLVHRLLSSRGKWLLTGGDANDIIDMPVHRDSTIGRVTGLYRGGILEQIPACRESKRQRWCRLLAQSSFVFGPLVASATIASMRFAYRLAGKVRTA